MRWDIVATRGHYEVFTAEGHFLFSADTRAEALKELQQWEEESIA